MDVYVAGGEYQCLVHSIKALYSVLDQKQSRDQIGLIWMLVANAGLPVFCINTDCNLGSVFIKSLKITVESLEEKKKKKKKFFF